MDSLGRAIVQSATEMENAPREYCILEENANLREKFQTRDAHGKQGFDSLLTALNSLSKAGYRLDEATTAVLKDKDCADSAFYRLTAVYSRPDKS